MSVNLGPPHDSSDEEGGRVYFPTTPTQGPSRPQNTMSRSASRNSAWSMESPAHRRQGNTYNPTTSSSFRPTSPIPRRINSTSSRYHTMPGIGHRSTSVSTTGRDEDGSGGDVSEDDNDLTPGTAKARDDGDAAGPDREFTEEDPLTLKDRQSLINVEHPFGLPIWKPALYKKSRTVTRDAETEVHSVPTAILDWHYIPGNVFWTVCFGWWIALVTLLVAGILSLIPLGGRRYAWLLLGLSWYIFWPFGKYVEGDVEDEDSKDDQEDVVGDGETPEQYSNGAFQSNARGKSPILESVQENNPSVGVPLTSYSTISTITPSRVREQILQTNVSAERTPLISTGPSQVYGTINPSDPKASIEVAFAGHWLGKAVFWLAFTALLAPILLIVTLICWGLVITIPMAKLNWELLKHLWSRPLNIRFCAAPPPTVVPNKPTSSEQDAAAPAGASYTIQPTRLSAGQVAPHLSGTPRSTVLLCTYRAVGLRYYKYTIGGVNILFINLLPVVFFVIFDGLVLLPLAERREHAGTPLTGFLAFFASRALIFVMSILSVIPLSYFIGMAVASISAQSSIGMGAVINATFGSIIEIILYGMALTQGKGRLVEGSIVGSILAGVLLMPGLSMCGGALRQKEQKFNAKSAGVTSTMLIMAIIGVLTPTMFYQVYGNVSSQEIVRSTIDWLTSPMSSFYSLVMGALLLEAI